MTATETTAARSSAPARVPLTVSVVIAALCLVIGFAAHTDHPHGLATHAYTGTIIIVSADHNAIGLDIATGGRGTGNGFAFAPGVHDDGLTVGQRVAMDTVDVSGRGEEIVDIRPE